MTMQIHIKAITINCTNSPIRGLTAVMGGWQMTKQIHIKAITINCTNSPIRGLTAVMGGWQMTKQIHIKAITINRTKRIHNILVYHILNYVLFLATFREMLLPSSGKCEW